MDKTKRAAQIFWTTWNAIEALILVAGGIFCIAFRENNELNSLVSILIGSFIALDGALRVILFFAGLKSSTESIALIGGFEITTGLVIIFKFDVFLEIVIMFLYILLIVIGILVLGIAIMKIIRHQSTIFIPILTIIIGAILLGLGLSLCILKVTGGADANVIVLIIIGCILCVAGGTLLTGTIIQCFKGLKKPAGTGPQNHSDRKSEDPHPFTSENIVDEEIKEIEIKQPEEVIVEPVVEEVKPKPKKKAKSKVKASE